MNALTPASSTLVIFCRRPAAGTGKRRVAAELGEEFTLALSEHLLAATLEDARDWPGEVVLCPSDPADEFWAAGLLGGATRVLPQPRGNLGERINAVDGRLRADTPDNAAGEAYLYIGSDAPVLDGDYYRAARAVLTERDVVLGPAADGGVTLMGARRPWPDLTGLAWSTDCLGVELERCCIDSGLTLGRLDCRYDVDLAADLDRLRADLRDDHRPARRRLFEWLDTQKLLQADSPQ